MWKKSNSLVNRVTSGMMACLLTAATVLSPLTSMPVYAKESILDLNYKNVEKNDVEIYIQSENNSFEPGQDIELKLFIENNTDMTLTNGGLSWKDKKDALNDEQFLYDENEEPDIEINEKGSLTNITLEPNEIFEVDFTAIVDSSLEFTNKRTIDFFFGSENAENADEKVTRRAEFDFVTGLVTLLPIESENEAAAGTTGSMNVWLAVNDPERYVIIPEGGLATDSNAEEVTATDSNAEEMVETDSNAAELASDSDAEEMTATDSNSEEEEEDVLKIDKLIYNIETYGVEFKDIWIASAVATDSMEGIIATIEYDVDAKTPAGTYFGKLEAEVKMDGKTYCAQQGFDITVTEALTAEQLAEVQRVIELIDKLPEPEEVWAKAEALYNAGDIEGYEAYVKYIAELAWPAYYAYQALNDAQKALVTNYYKLELTAGLWSVMTLDLEPIIYSGSDLVNLLKEDSARDTEIVLKQDKTVRLTSKVTDPWVWIDLSDGSKIGNNYCVLITYLRADETTGTRNMRLYPVNNEISADDTNSITVDITDEYYDYAVFDFTSYNYLSKIRFDFVDNSAAVGYSIDIDYIGFFASEAEAKEYVEKNRPDAEKDTDKTTFDGNGAIKFQLFDYSKYINKTEKNDSDSGYWRKFVEYFNFRGSDEMEGKYGRHVYSENGKSSYINKEYDEDGFTDNHATVERNLEGNYPVLDLTRDAKGNSKTDPGLSSAERSLAYLFGGGERDSIVKVYTPSNTILQYDSETGIYSYNSAENAVDYDRTEKVFRVRGYNERNSSTADADPDEKYYDFIPFNYTNGKTINGENYHIDKFDVNYWFGMRMDVNFYQGKDGQFMDDDMIFSFSGDDDVWVFIDGKLALDLGGTHGTVDGTINFATGEIEQYLNWKTTNKKDVYDQASVEEKETIEGYYSTTLYDAFLAAYKDAGKTDEEAKAECAKIFEEYSEGKYRLKSYTEHKLSFFYMERGASVANCKIKFNLPTVPDESLTVTKVLEDEGGFIPDGTEYKFKVLKKNSDELFIKPDTLYEILENNKEVPNGKVDENGVFTIKAGQSARFLDMLKMNEGETEYRVVEILENTASYSNAVNWDYKMLYSEVQIDAAGKTVNKVPDSSDNGHYETDILSAESSNVVTYTNKVKAGDLKLYKKVVCSDGNEGTSGVFTFEVSCEALAGKTYQIESGSNAERTFNNEGKMYVSVKAGESVTIKNLPAGVEITLKEVGYNGYIPGWEEDNNVRLGDSTTVMILNKETITVTCVNKTGTELPITGGTGTRPYRMGGTLIMLLAAGYLLINERRYSKKEKMTA